MNLNRDHMVEMLRKMILIREFDELSIKLRLAGKIYGTFHPYVGQEAVAVGVCQSLTIADRVASNHRGHGHCIAKGADIKRMMAELFGRVDGYCKGKGGSMHIADFSVGMLGANGIVGAGLPIATGAALAAQLEGQGNVAVCFFGDGAVAEGTFHEALNISAVWKLPIVFVCENNLHASNCSVEVQHKVTDLWKLAAGYGMPGTVVDGNDLLAVYEVARESIDRAREGEGPTLLECKTYRWYFHAMRATVPPETRPEDERKKWIALDPIPRFEGYLKNNFSMDDAGLAEIHDGVRRDLEAAVAFAEKSPFPDPKDLLVDMFA